MDMTNKRKITIGYIFFYILFSVDTWRILVGILISTALAPQLGRYGTLKYELTLSTQASYGDMYSQIPQYNYWI